MTNPAIHPHRLLAIMLAWRVLGNPFLFAEEPVTLTPQPVAQTDGVFELTAETAISARFHALHSTTWPNGLVPIFGYEVRGIYQLSRKPKTGWENLMEPVFFALPGESETNASRLSGDWTVSAKNMDGRTDDFAWELTTDADQIAGRFDPHTDYRFATISGGTWRTNQLEVNVDYINEHFELSGQLTDGELSGTWRRTDDGDSGVWNASRLRPDPVIRTNGYTPSRLFEWTSDRTKERVYSTEEIRDNQFTRSEIPLCRVWRKGE